MPPAILVVDDDPADRAWLARLLAAAGYAVRTAPDGEAALAEVAREPPDLVLADVLMPRLDGAALAARLLARRPRVPVVLVSAYRTASPVPGVAFVPKPLDPGEVLDAVERELAGAGG